MRGGQPPDLVHPRTKRWHAALARHTISADRRLREQKKAPDREI